MPTKKLVKSRKVSAYVKLVLKRQALNVKLFRLNGEITRRQLALTGSQQSQAYALLNAAQTKLSHEAEASVVRVIEPRAKPRRVNLSPLVTAETTLRDMVADVTGLD